jgi:uncharacterized protein YqeY
MTLVNKIKSDAIVSMKGKETEKLSTLRLLIAELEKEKVQHKLVDVTKLSDEQTQAVINRQVKKLDKEIEAYVSVGRSVEKQETEKELLLAYLPKQLSEEEIRDFVAGVVATSKTVGEAMKSLSAQLKGKADMGLVSKIVREMNK